MKNLLRNLAYVSVIIAALTVTFHYSVRTAQAIGTAGLVIAGAPNDQYVTVDLFVRHLQAGSYPYPAWTVNNPQYNPLPATPAFVGDRTFVDTSGNGWTREVIGGFEQWVNAGPPPGGPIAVTPTTWSEIKTKHRAPTGN